MEIFKILLATIMHKYCLNAIETDLVCSNDAAMKESVSPNVEFCPESFIVVNVASVGI